MADFIKQGAFDVEIFGDDLDDPVTVGDEAHVVVEVADRDEASGVGRVEGRGLGLLEAFEGGEDELVALGLWRVGGCAGRDDVEEDDGKAGVSDVRMSRPIAFEEDWLEEGAVVLEDIGGELRWAGDLKAFGNGESGPTPTA